VARIRYQVAMSLDGYIAGPKGEADWIVMDPDIDFTALCAQFDTFLMGWRTFEATGAGGLSAGKNNGGVPAVVGDSYLLSEMRTTLC
jgi:dihydrofolate reductase